MTATNFYQKASEHLRQGQHEEAIALFQQCLEHDPQDQRAALSLGLALLLSGEADEALSVWLSAVMQAEEIGEAASAQLITQLIDQLLQAAKQQTEPFQQEQLYRVILEFDPNHAIACQALADLLVKREALDEALSCYQHLVTLQPDHIPTHHKLSVLLEYYNRIEEAIACQERIIAIDPGNIPAHYNIVVLLERQGRLEDGIAYYRTLLTLEPHSSRAHSYLGLLLHRQGALEEALPYHQKALALDPKNPEAHINYGIWLLQQGKLVEGLAEFEWRDRDPDLAPRSFPYPRWDGSTLAGKTILIHSHYGFGDTIQFIRFVPQVKQLGATVIMLCQPAVFRLLQGFTGIDSLVADRGAETDLSGVDGGIDIYVELMSLPHLLGTTLETLPSSPYLKAPVPQTPITPERTTQKIATQKITSPNAALPEWEPPLMLTACPSTFNIGMVWGGNPSYPYNRTRSCSLRLFLPLLSVPGTTFHSLQKGEPADELTRFPEAAGIHDWGSPLRDFADTAAAIAQLDLVITTDTAVAHLAGALGQPTWVLLSYVPDWRWFLKRTDSPWYQGMRLFRQPQPNDWDSVFQQVVAALRQRVQDRQAQG
ncbi:MAG TPA: tetratricopeptide repeat protein [Chroococcidiopsis sp.]